MGMINLGSSMRYGPSGKKRKTTAWTTTKRKSCQSSYTRKTQNEFI